MTEACRLRTADPLTIPGSEHVFVAAIIRDKIRGTIVGSALGDCIGLYTDKFKKLAWTDDTDHAIMVILSYLYHGGRLLPNDVAHRLRTSVEQGLRCLDRLPLGLGKTAGSVVCDKEYLEDPSAVAYKKWKDSGYKIAPNGSLMRTHPLGIMCLRLTLEDTFWTAAGYSAITHADPRCIVACCICTGLIRGIIRGEVIDENGVDAMIDSAFDWVQNWLKRGRLTTSDEDFEVLSNPVDKESGQGDHTDDADVDEDAAILLDREELDQHIRAKSFSELELDDAMKMGYVYKALGSAILALRVVIRQAPYTNHGDEVKDTIPHLRAFEMVITTLVMEGGDADTNACVAGALLGSWLGFNVLPSHWRDGLTHRDWLIRKTDAVAEVAGALHNRSSPCDGREDRDTWPDGGKGFLTREQNEKREKRWVHRLVERQRERDRRGKDPWDREKGWRARILPELGV